MIDLLSTHRVGWDQTEEENWSGRKFFRGPLGQLVTPAFCPFQGGTLTEKEEGEGRWEEREQQEFGAGALCIVGVAACF